MLDFTSQLADLESQFVTLEEGAARLGITRRALDRLIERGSLQKIMFKGKSLLPVREIDLYQFRKQQKASRIQMYSRKNLFNGLNPLLMSLLQTPGSGGDKSLYPSFHGEHIIHIKEHLNEVLPPNYRARSLQSIQIQRSDDGVNFKRTSDPVPDVSIYKLKSGGQPQATTLKTTAAEPSLILTTTNTFAAPPALLGVGIFRIGDHQEIGEPVVRIELLSPSNKLPHPDAQLYQQNRYLCYAAGTDLIEIDYLHESISPIIGLPKYPQDADSFLYSITLNRVSTNQTLFYGFSSNTPIPTLTIPLVQEDHVIVDFDAIYQYTFYKGYWGELPSIDYRQPPLRFETYSQPDQATIQAHLTRIQQGEYGELSSGS